MKLRMFCNIVSSCLGTVLLALTAGCAPDTALDTDPELAQAGAALNGSSTSGAQLFKKETFGGNGRTCETCHSMSTGTISPEQLQHRFQQKPDDPIFRALDSDGGAGLSYTRLLNDATILVALPLPPHVQLLDDPSATHVVLERGVPSTLDIPALDGVLMWDGRAPSLEAQALDAVLGHAAAAQVPTDEELVQIADFERSLFSSEELALYAQGGPEPVLPAGSTEAEQRGRAFFAPTGLCGQCHSGPLLNERPNGTRFAGVQVSNPALNPMGRPGRTYVITQPDGTQVQRVSTDPGRFLITGNLADFNRFKIPALRNIKKTAPYFHDNSAKTLEATVAHYANFFAGFGITLSAQDQRDIVEFMKLL